MRRFHPMPGTGEIKARRGDLVWIGNWGDAQRAAEIEEFVLGPMKRLQLRARIHGVRYPDRALSRVDSAGADFAGWLPNFRMPAVFARHAVTVHVPRRPFAHAPPGIPTMRMFEALACGIPLVSGSWEDAGGPVRPRGTTIW